MSEDYGATQDCFRCVGALRAARRRLDGAVAHAERARELAADARQLAASEERRSRNADPVHQHVGGRSKSSGCTLATHAEDAKRLLGDAKNEMRQAREWERAAIDEAKRIGKAADKLLAGCDLCGRPPMPAKWRAA